MLVPAGQDWHLFRPVLLLNMLTGQGAQRMEPSLGAYEPAGQSRGVTVAGVGHCLPMGHSAHVAERDELA